MFQSEEVTLGTPWVGSSRTFISYVGVPGGAIVDYDLRLSCTDKSIADNITALVMEHTVTGAVGRLVPAWSVTESDADGQGASYGFITNNGADTAFVPVVSVIEGVGVGNTSCSVKIGDKITESFDVSFQDTVDDVGAQLFSTIQIVPVVKTLSQTAFKGESVSVELDITVPPWSGKESMELTFRPEDLINSAGQAHHWRMCRVDIVNVDTDLTCLAEGAAEYGSWRNGVTSVEYEKTNDQDFSKWYNDIGTITVPRTCPSQLNETGHHTFRARAFFENYPQSSGYFSVAYPSPLTTNLVASASFSNGSDWSSNFNVQLSPSAWDTARDHDSWMSCMDGEWFPLPSGKMVCHMGDFSKHEVARNVCRNAGGYLAELTNRDDMQTLNYIMWSGRKASVKSANRFRIGAVASSGQWRWEETGETVDMGPGRILKHSDDTADLTAYDNTFAYLKLVGFSSSYSYLNSLPYFDLYLEVGADTEDEFLCMKDGLGSASDQYQFTVAPTEFEIYKPGEIIKNKFRLKIPHGTSRPQVKFQAFAYKMLDDVHIRMCKVFISHVGRNYPCVKNPMDGPMTGQNSSTFQISYSDDDQPIHEMYFDQIKNYGTGYFASDGNVDADTIEFTALYTPDPKPGSILYTGYLKYYLKKKDDTLHYGYNRVYLDDPTSSLYQTSYSGTVDVTETLEGGNQDLVKGHCKRITYAYKFPKGAKFKAVHKVQNKEFSNGKYVTFCGIYTRAGENLPCTPTKDVSWSPMAGYENYTQYNNINNFTSTIDWSQNIAYDDQNTSMFYEYAASYAEMIQSDVVVGDEEDQVYVEVSVRADKLAPENTIISLQFMVEFGSTLVATVNTLLQVKELTAANNPKDYYNDTVRKEKDRFLPFEPPNMKNFTETTGLSLNGTVRDFLWVPFKISLPPEGVWPVKLLVQSPVKNGRSVFHLVTARFAKFQNYFIKNICPRFPPANMNCSYEPVICTDWWNGQGDSLKPGDNILGVNQWIDIERTYSMEKIKSSRITTHGQFDQLFIDFGFLTNTGMSQHWLADDGMDNVFVIQIGVEISDHQETEDGSSHDLSIAVDIADTIVTGNHSVSWSH